MGTYNTMTQIIKLSKTLDSLTRRLIEVMERNREAHPEEVDRIRQELDIESSEWVKQLERLEAEYDA